MVTLKGEIKRCLLLERKAMTNLDSILKSRDITLLTKVLLVKAMVFPVVMDEWGEGNGNPLQYSCHLFLISSASVRSILFLSFIKPIFA